VKDRVIMYVVFLSSRPISHGSRSAKFEAPENDLSPSVPFRVAGFPTLKFKPAGTKDWIDYDGDRSLESLISFVDEHAKNSLVPPSKDEPTTHQPPIEFHEQGHDEL
jgi:protein disulfide-isomerase A1